MKQEKEPAAIRELHRIREKLLADEERVGSGAYWAEANREAREFARRHGLKYVEAKPGVATIREKPSKRYKLR
ncbi:MAG: hypothetical protein HY360_13750 [Verrucomicrobia bacterium]|nr:hypothetical protein [Verrucomicrobiota bacterium]